MKNENTQTIEFIPNFEDLYTTGQITANTYLFFDYNTAQYIYLNKETGDRKYLNQTSAAHKLSECFKNAGVSLKNPVKELQNVKKVSSSFDITKDEFWNDSLNLNYNQFQERKTLLKFIDICRSEKTEFSTMLDFNLKVPATMLLLHNLMENDAKAVEHFINWFSSFVNTRKKNLTAFMFAGVEGAGKGVLINKVLSPILSSDYTAELMASELTNQFNDSLENKLLINFNEVSSDFSKTDTATQTLKSLITDPSFIVNGKHRASYKATNNFLVILSQNYLNGVKISTTDRRFNYFVSEKSLKVAVKEKLNIDINEFISRLENEVIKFAELLATYNFDSLKANSIYNTKNRERAQRATSNAFDMLIYNLKNGDFEQIKNDIEEVVEIFEETSDKSKYSDNYLVEVKSTSALIESLKEELNLNVISNKNLKSLYTLLVKDSKGDSDRVLNKIFESHLGSSIVKYINNKSIRVRALSSTENAKVEF